MCRSRPTRILGDIGKKRDSVKSRPSLKIDCGSAQSRTQACHSRMSSRNTDAYFLSGDISLDSSDNYVCSRAWLNVLLKMQRCNKRAKLSKSTIVEFSKFPLRQSIYRSVFQNPRNSTPRPIVCFGFYRKWQVRSKVVTLRVNF
jgi:hypothetical protein